MFETINIFANENAKDVSFYVNYFCSLYKNITSDLNHKFDSTYGYLNNC